MAGLIDVHQHIIYGIDDGPRTLDDSLRMMMANRENDVFDVVATSHALPAMEPFPLERYFRHLNKLNQISDEQGIGVRLYSGCEVFYSDVAVRQLLEQRLPTLANSRFTLIEFDPTSTLDVIEGAIRRLTNAGFIPIIAHCERYDAMVRSPEETVALRHRLRMRLQINAATVISRQPRRVRVFCERLMNEGALDYIASDAHGHGSRPPNLQQAYRTLSKKRDMDDVAQWLGGRQMELWDWMDEPVE